jgi:hypothetical protein
MWHQFPCKRRSLLNDLNSLKPKSLAYTALIPSFPNKPTPTSDSIIMLTSFAPSPIAKVIFFNFSLTSFTTAAFYFGVAREVIAVSHPFNKSKNGP